MSSDYISVKKLADIVGLSPRAIQIKRASGEIQGRKKDSKSYEIYIPSLPSDWQVKLLASGESKPEGTALVTLAPAAQIEAVRQSPSLRLLSREMTEKEKQRALIAEKLRENRGLLPHSKLISSVAFVMGVSKSTVRRVEEEVAAYGIIGRPRQLSSQGAFSPDAIVFLQGAYLSNIHDNGSESKKTAIAMLERMAAEKGWKIGSKSGAYSILSDINPLLVRYAKEGNRGLDNLFYISRDCLALRPFQVIIGDQHIFDWWVADYETGLIRRPECYAWLDMGTKLIYGIAFAEKSYNEETVKEALRIGLYRHGRFECTYNDNGTSECSKATNQIIEDLQRLNMGAKDFAELDRTPDGYVVEDENGNIIDTASTESEWRKKNRRIFAQVRNAKAKDIERFFRTIEGRLSDRCLPGRVANPASNAAEDEQERARLERQKNGRQLLTIEEFAQVLGEELEAYETTVHGSLEGLTPRQALQKKIAGGWKSSPINLAEVDFILFSRRMCTVQSGRILLNKRWYIGAAQTQTSGKLDDVGLWKFKDGTKVEIRYSNWNPEFCIANVGGEANPLRALVPVTRNVMLDDIALEAEMEKKRSQMKAVRQSFTSITALIENPTYRPAEKILDVNPEDIEKPAIEDRRRLEKPKPAITPFISLSDKATPRKRFAWCVKMMQTGNTLGADDMAFMQAYRLCDEYKKRAPRWELEISKIPGGF